MSEPEPSKVEEAEDDEKTQPASAEDDEQDEALVKLFADMGIKPKKEPQDVPKPAPLFRSFDIAGIADLIKGGKAKRIVCMCGAGISVSAGIPDFRTPGTGLYSQLDKYNLPAPESIFTLSYFRRHPEPFHQLARELFPGRYAPTPTHHFMRLLHSKGLLQRCFTQNIDSLEQLAGLPKDMVVAAHGNFDSAACIECEEEYPPEWVKAKIEGGEICRCSACEGLVKPSIVFFGEGLPERFFQRATADMPKCDLLLVMGTSLAVYPFAGLIGYVRGTCPRVLVNRECVGDDGRPGGFDFDASHRDVWLGGDCDSAVQQLAAELGWGSELGELVAAGKAACAAAAGDGNDDRAGAEQRADGTAGLCCLPISCSKAAD
uniref:Deacetylase sirtuin-type domain-containing protein n=1 Tax=Chlamydomonas leiostraca TaxID=1034604 RepID=A0A7S0RTZ3_9CHLO|mmetsp:Transcript_31299/g.79831  ORF Transcript_31299/g.79831 Transcript_31299/m.79831 type:complete len:375 (+) Transcript_31299:163-1287(+)|eukprot:CAMPEP_0202858638 /NCGR_PEP_ID=MMETSP1391-20130828/1080_1 /ASSEMBLY_ACC=CAM_ASM_000867 /TAXON_ID=1034604 /ORGANISM="Chlamydomonas leiostraca, Strain SAG 11-49" /LENGTH=374 /DNA_ID=CAMNT_0049537571 /DNA_START=141 /DNA_END=1265 /DNA_ORIENTATION=-